MKRTLSFATLIAWSMLAVGIGAHHSGSEYDRTTIEIQGQLLEVAWQNPHVHFIVQTRDPSGKTVTWDIEANSLSILRRTDATPENLKVGDTIKIVNSLSTWGSLNYARRRSHLGRLRNCSGTCWNPFRQSGCP